MTKAPILLVEDDSTLGYILTEYLELNGYPVTWTKNGKDGLEKINKLPFRLCILDVMMPEMDGFEVARRVKDQKINIPIIFLTAKSLKIDKLKGFKLGADDFITKPVDEEELLARINAVLRRSDHSLDPSRQLHSNRFIGKYEFDAHSRSLVFAGEAILITEKETRLLDLLARNKNQLVLRAEALKEIWGTNDYFTRKSMDVHIHKLRKLLIKDQTVKITNIHGKGFILYDPGSVQGEKSGD